MRTDQSPVVARFGTGAEIPGGVESQRILDVAEYGEVEGLVEKNGGDARGVNVSSEMTCMNDKRLVTTAVVHPRRIGIFR
jgi:hypothetical protein